MFSRENIINQTDGAVNNSTVMKLAHAITKSTKARYGNKYTYASLFRDALISIYCNDVPMWRLRWLQSHGQMIKTGTSNPLW